MLEYCIPKAARAVALIVRGDQLHPTVALSCQERLAKSYQEKLSRLADTAAILAT
jgi:hypothetical protein